MSVKAISLVWDLECPIMINGLPFRPAHKFVLVAYADHADHNGKNIWPAISTVARKTGFDERTIQRLTSDLSQMSLLLEDGLGPKGTNRWSLPYSQGGDSLSPPAACRDDNESKALGDIPSGDTLPPELNKPEPGESELLQKILVALFPREIRRQQSLEKSLADCRLKLSDSQLVIDIPENAELYQDRYARSFENALTGILNRHVEVVFKASNL